LENHEDDVDWTFFALKGVTLKETIKGVLERKGLNLEEVDLFLESSNTPLPLETDTSFFAGHKLNVR
uniref:RBD domain-containing protein n=1 Tax=Romanomermis culicivorax TaxID=13658 RepID=A0A915L6H3_ROMCU